MKSNKHIIAMAVCGVIMASGSAFAAALPGSSVTTNPGSAAGSQGTGGVVHFTGKITDVSCDVTTDTKNQTVDLGTWAKSYFDAQSETTLTPFNIKVENCPDTVKTVAVLFDGTSDTNDATLLKTSGPAEGVGIKLYEDDRSTAIKINSVSKSQDVDSTSGKGSKTLNFFADYKATGVPVTTGDANADANFLMVYN